MQYGKLTIHSVIQILNPHHLSYPVEKEDWKISFSPNGKNLSRTIRSLYLPGILFASHTTFENQTFMMLFGD